MQIHYEFTIDLTGDLDKTRAYPEFCLLWKELRERYKITNYTMTAVNYEVIYKSPNFVIVGDSLEYTSYLVFDRKSESPCARFNKVGDALDYVRVKEKQFSDSQIYLDTAREYKLFLTRHGGV